MEITKSGDETSTRVKHQKGSKESSSDSDSYLISLDEETKQKLLKKLKKLKKKEKKKKKKKEKKRKEKEGERRQKKPAEKGSDAKETVHAEKDIGPRCSRNFVPMTKEEWERQQNTLRRVYDEETGRMRLIRGTNEIVEECVGRERQLLINKQATIKDGEYFQRVLAISRE